MVEKCYYNWKFDEIVYGEEKMKTREDKRVVKLDFNFQDFPYWTYIFKKISTLLFGAWSFLLVHIQLTPSEEPKDFI